MKKIVFLAGALIYLGACGCNKQATPVTEKEFNELSANETKCFEGKIVKKGLCGQLVVQVTSPATEGLSLAASWTDSSTGTTYQNVFTVANYCDLPAHLSTGMVLQFKLSSKAQNDCSLCQAYTPVPKESNIIRMGCD